MLPSIFVVLESMPLTETGKIDRESLPAPEQSRPALEQSYAAPATALENIVAGIFGEVLKIERVGVCDNFFELGGHSLLATRVVSKIRQIFAIELQVRKLFEEPTVSGLASVILKNESARIERTAELLREISTMSDDAVTAMLEESPERIRKGRPHDECGTFRPAAGAAAEIIARGRLPCTRCGPDSAQRAKRPCSTIFCPAKLVVSPATGAGKLRLQHTRGFKDRGGA